MLRLALARRWFLGLTGGVVLPNSGLDREAPGGLATWRLARTGSAKRNTLGDKAGAWKSPYHNGRAMIQGLVLLSSLGEPLLLATPPSRYWDGPYQHNKTERIG
jgi:hypothetical protein